MKLESSVIFSRFLFLEESEEGLELVVLDDEVEDFVDDYLTEEFGFVRAYSGRTIINGYPACRSHFLDLSPEERGRLIRAVSALKEETLEEIWRCNNQESD